MQIKLNRTAFRRLVQMYMLSTAVCIALAARFLIVPRWAAFEEEFRLLAETHFGGPPPDWLMWLSLAVGALSIEWIVVSIAGLFWFKRWARLGTWASIPGCFIAMLVMIGETPEYTTLIDDLFTMTNSALLGAIVLLSYAKGYGAEWFALPAIAAEE